MCSSNGRAGKVGRVTRELVCIVFRPFPRYVGLFVASKSIKIGRQLDLAKSDMAHLGVYEIRLGAPCAQSVIGLEHHYIVLFSCVSIHYGEIRFSRITTTQYSLVLLREGRIWRVM